MIIVKTVIVKTVVRFASKIVRTRELTNKIPNLLTNYNVFNRNNMTKFVSNNYGFALAFFLHFFCIDSTICNKQNNKKQTNRFQQQCIWRKSAFYCLSSKLLSKHNKNRNGFISNRSYAQQNIHRNDKKRVVLFVMK